MAKPKTRRGRRRPAVEEKSAKTLGYRVSPAYVAWITKDAVANRSTLSGLIDQAAARYAREIAVEVSPSDRTA